MAILPHWFDMHRSLAVGIATAGAGLGGVAYSIITARLVAAVDIPWTYRILSFCGLASNATCSLLLRDHKRVARRHPSDKASASNVSTSTSRSLGFRRLAVRTEVLLVTAWGFVTELGYVALLYIFPYYAASAGLTPAQGSAAQAALNLGLGLGRPVVGHYSDRWGRINVALAATLLCALLCLVVWTLAGPSFPALLAFAFLAGVVAGTFWTTFAPVLAEVVGLDEYAGAFAFVCMALVLPNTFAEAVTMQMVNDTKVPGEEGVGWRFLGAQAFVGGMFLGGAVFLWLLRAWKVCNNERGATQREEEYVMESPAGQSESEAGEGREGSAVGTERAVRMEEQRWLTMKRLFAVAKV